MSEQKNKVGRPLKWTKIKALELADEYILWLEEDYSHLFVIEFLRSKNIRHAQWGELSNKYPEFSVTVKRAESLKRQNYWLGAMNGIYNPTMAIFYGKNELGMADKIEQKVEQKVTEIIFERNSK